MRIVSNVKALWKFVFQWQKKQGKKRWIALVLIVIALSMGWLFRQADPKRVTTWIFVIFYFFHLALGAGAAYSVLRLWQNRRNPFIWRVAVYMHAMALHAILAIVLVFLARGVKLTWKFAIAWFTGTMLMDLARTPLILYLIRGPGENVPSAHEPRAGELPPEIWMAEFTAIKDSIRNLRELIESKWKALRNNREH